MLYEIHMLKNYPATNLNRDDSGTPKTCVFGGVTRGRISSQCLKRSWRRSDLFQELLSGEKLGIRTRKLPEEVAEILRAQKVDEETIQNWLPVLSGIANKDGKASKDGVKTAQIVFYAPEDIRAVADQVLDFIRVKKEKAPGPGKNKKEQEAVDKERQTLAKKLQSSIKDANIRPITLDIALFGRMVTSDAFRDVEAAMQVAHAVSTNRVVMESDYYTAMDDLLQADTLENKGSSMIGDIDYNSACYYLYASLDSDKLRENLDTVEDADQLVRQAIPVLLRTMALSNPSGKQNSFAGHVLPSAVLVECKEKKIPVSYVNAYTEPARATGKKDLVESSIEKLVEECNMTTRNFGLPVEKRLWFCVDKYQQKCPEGAEHCASFPALVDAVAESLQ